MSDNYTTFRKFPDAGQAKELQQLLLDNNIECLFIDNSPGLGSSFSGDLLKEYEIQVHKDNFEKAADIVENQAANMLNDIPEDYYLLTFSDDELYDVLVKRDEWSEFDYLLARHLLEERGKTISEDEITKMRRHRLMELAQPEKNHISWIIFGYVCAILGGLFGITTGYVLMTAQKTLPDGNKVYTYTPSDRAHGRIIFILGLVVLALIAVLKILKFF